MGRACMRYTLGFSRAGAPEDDCRGHLSVGRGTTRWKVAESIGDEVSMTLLLSSSSVANEWARGHPYHTIGKTSTIYAMVQNCWHMSECRHYSSKYHINNAPFLWLSTCRS